MKKVYAVMLMLLVSSLTGCGYIDRLSASAIGGASEVCVAGVVYLQFASGVTVKYTPDGQISKCNK